MADGVCLLVRPARHTHDSICIYCQRAGVLFSGDTQLLFHRADGSYEEDYVSAPRRLARRSIRTVLPGHGDPRDR